MQKANENEVLIREEVYSNKISDKAMKEFTSELKKLYNKYSKEKKHEEVA